MRIQLDTGLSGFKTLKPYWQSLEQHASANAFISYEWCEHQASFQAQNDVYVLSAWEQNECIAVLPLTTKRLSKRFNTRVVTHLCQRFTDYQHLLCTDDAHTASVFNAMHEHIKTSTSPLKQLSWYVPYPAPVFHEALCSAGANECQPWQHTLYRLNGAPVKAKVAREARRRKRKLEQTGHIEVNADAAFDEPLIHWILDRSAQRHGSNSLTDQKHRESVLALFKHYRAHLHLAYIKKDGDYLAAHLGFKQQNTLYYYVPVTTDEQRSLSPGIILLHEIIQQLPTMQLDTIDFLRGEESYKQDWGNTFSNHSGVLLKGSFGLNAKNRLFTELWLKRNSG